MVTAVVAVLVASVPIQRSPEVSRRWHIESTTVTQDRGDWQIDYKIRLQHPNPVRLLPGDISVSHSGTLSTSSSRAHSRPTDYHTAVDSRTGLNVVTDIVKSGTDTEECAERTVVRIWSGGQPAPVEPHTELVVKRDSKFERVEEVIVPAGGVLNVRLRLEHNHFLYGAYNQLFGTRSLRVRLGADVLCDRLVLDRERYTAYGPQGLPEVPPERRSGLQFVSPPDSMHLDVTDTCYFRYIERPVRYSCRMRVSFWYLTAPGTHGNLHVLVAQYKDSPNGWQVLHKGAVDREFAVVGRWTREEITFVTQEDATSAALVFKIVQPANADEVGEVWVDDVAFVNTEIAPDRP